MRKRRWNANKRSGKERGGKTKLFERLCKEWQKCDYKWGTNVKKKIGGG